MDMFKIPIRLLNEDACIFYTEEHFLQLFNLLTIENTKSKELE